MKEEDFIPVVKPSYTRRKRSLGIHREMQKFSICSLKALIDGYSRHHQFEGELRRQMRDVIRRYQEYVIANNFKAHYLENSIHHICRTEHIIPITQITDFLISESLTLVEALEAPVAFLSKETELVVSRIEGSFNHNPWFPFRRYVSAGNLKGVEIHLKTIFGDGIDLNEWTLSDHYNLVEKIWREGKEKIGFLG